VKKRGMGRKRIVLLLIVLGTLLGVFLLQIYSDLLWGNEPERDREEEVIRIWTIHGDTERALNTALEQYKEKHPGIRFEITLYKNEVYQIAINNAVLTDSLPDMFFMWGYSKLQRFVDADMIQEITDLVREEDVASGLREGTLDAFTYEDKIYALPLYGWRASLFCNREVFRQCGVEYPKTYDQFLKVIEEVKKRDLVPVVTGAKEGWLSSLYYMSLVQGEGPGNSIYQAEADRKLFTAPQFVEAAKKMEQLIDGGIWQKGFLEYDAYNAVHLFSQGEAAMLYYGSWASTFIEGNSSKVEGLIDVVPFPNGKDSEGIGGYVDTFVINKYGAIPKKQELIRMYMEIMEAASNIAVNDMGAGIPVYKNQTVDQDKFPILYQCWNINRDKTMYPAYDQIMSEELSGQYYYYLNQLVFGEKTYQEFIRAMSD
jgi:raffinose/stachyose/melibiose transport system substrate-binding protein